MNRQMWIAASIFATTSIIATAMNAGTGRSANAGDIAFGQHLSGECVTCHRQDGQEKGIPSIVGWPEDQFVAVLKSYKAKDRPNQVMQTITAGLSEDEMAALAAFYAALKTTASPK